MRVRPQTQLRCTARHACEIYFNDWSQAQRSFTCRPADSDQTMRPRKTILCVDDNDVALSIRKFMLETMGYRVLTASGGEQAITVFREGGIELLLTDLVMPLMDGNELVRKIKAINSEIPAVIFSGTVTSYDRATHADAFITKGIPVADLLARIRMMIARKRGPKKRPKMVPPIIAAEQVTA